MAFQAPLLRIERELDPKIKLLLNCLLRVSFLKIIFYNLGIQSLRQSDYTLFTLELNCSGICSQAGECSAERTVPD
jgi:hypothetical protein